jgi:hypothetical protein
MPDLEEREFTIAAGILDDCRRHIAAHKIQRWDVVKWGVSVNLALAVAAATPALASVRFYLLLLSCGVAVASWLLVLHYNRRMTGTRNQAQTTISWLQERGVNYDAILGDSTRDAYASGENYDRQELRLFAYILGVSGLPTLLCLIFLPAK